MYRVRTLPQLSFEQAIKLAFSRLTQFNGRSRRSEFWWCYLAVVLLCMFVGWIPIVGSIISCLLELAMIPLTFRRLHDTGRSGWWWGIGAIGSTLFAIIAIIIAFGMMSNSSFTSSRSILDSTNGILILAFFAVCCLVFLAYGIAMIVFLCQDSQKGANQYGASPKYLLFKV